MSCLFHHFIIISRHYIKDGYELFSILHYTYIFLGGCVSATYLFVLTQSPQLDIRYVCMSAFYMCVFMHMCLCRNKLILMEKV